MIRTLAFLAIVASASAGLFNNPWYPGLHTHFGFANSFIERPRTVAKAKEVGYKKMLGPKMSSGYDALDMYGTESDNYLITLYFDENEQVAGLCVNLPKVNVTSHFDMTEQGYTSWTHNSVDYWRTCMFFVSQDKQTRINSADPSKLIRHDYLTVQGWNGTLDELPIKDSDIAADANWMKQACIPLMGQHYYRNMTPDLSCDKPFYSWFLLTQVRTNQIIGVAPMLIGVTECNMERPKLKDVQMIVPTAPKCLYDLVERIGAITLHIYFIDHPRGITC